MQKPSLERKMRKLERFFPPKRTFFNFFVLFLGCTIEFDSGVSLGTVQSGQTYKSEAPEGDGKCYSCTCNNGGYSCQYHTESADKCTRHYTEPGGK